MNISELEFKKSDLIITCEDGIKRKYYPSQSYCLSLFTEAGWFSESERKESLDKTKEYFHKVLLNYKNLPWWKKIFTPLAFTTFSNPDSSIYKV